MTIIESIFLKLKFSYIFCNVCGRFKKIKILSANFREDCTCKKCKSNSRKRHIAAILLHDINQNYDSKLTSLHDLPINLDFKIYNLENNGALHNNLKQTKDYVSSEYFGDYREFGSNVNGVLNVDLMNTPFDSDSFNYIVSTEVFEHIPNPYKAFKETYRILIKGGSHIFTVPYIPNVNRDIVKAIMNSKNEIEYLMEPEYHGDPIRDEEGILVFTIFTNEMISKLENIGFKVKVDKKTDYKLGIIGKNNFVFTATKK